MNWVDFILILIFLLSVLSSVRRGFILSVLDLLCWAGSLILSFLLYGPVSSFFEKHIISLGPWSAPLVFIVILVASKIALDTLANRLLNKIPEKMHRNMINRLFGIAPGVVNGFLWVMVLSTLLLLLPINSSASEDGRGSKLCSWVIGKANWLQDRFAPVFAELFNKIVPKPEAAVGEAESINLPFTVKNPKKRSDLEAEMLALVNEERSKHNLKPLKADPAIAVAARKHSADMFARGYFSHVTPEGKSPFQRIKDENIIFLVAGENLAFAQTLPLAHRGLMKSPGHRANILRPAFGRLGIGILDGGAYGLMITQNFRN